MSRAELSRATLVSISPGVVWAAHFTLVYMWAAVGCARTEPGEASSAEISIVTVGIAAATIVSLVLIALVSLPAWRRLRREPKPRSESEPLAVPRFLDAVTAWMGALSFVGVIWTAMPAVFVPECPPLDVAARHVFVEKRSLQRPR